MLRQWQPAAHGQSPPRPRRDLTFATSVVYCPRPPFLQVLHYTLQSDGQLRCTGDVQMQKGLGPRHIEFHPTLRVAYITNELTSTVSVCRFSAEREKELDNGAPLYDDLEAENALLKQV